MGARSGGRGRVLIGHAVKQLIIPPTAGPTQGNGPSRNPHVCMSTVSTAPLFACDGRTPSWSVPWLSDVRLGRCSNSMAVLSHVKGKQPTAKLPILQRWMAVPSPSTMSHVTPSRVR